MNKMEKVNTVHEVTPSGKQMFSKKNFRNCIILCSMKHWEPRSVFLEKFLCIWIPIRLGRRRSLGGLWFGVRQRSHCILFHFCCNNSRSFMSDIASLPSSVSPEMFLATVQTWRNCNNAKAEAGCWSQHETQITCGTHTTFEDLLWHQSLLASSPAFTLHVWERARDR